MLKTRSFIENTLIAFSRACMPNLRRTQLAVFDADGDTALAHGGHVMLVMLGGDLYGHAELPVVEPRMTPTYCVINSH